MHFAVCFSPSVLHIRSMCAWYVNARFDFNTASRAHRYCHFNLFFHVIANMRFASRNIHYPKSSSSRLLSIFWRNLQISMNFIVEIFTFLHTTRCSIASSVFFLYSIFHYFSRFALYLFHFATSRFIIPCLWIDITEYFSYFLMAHNKRKTIIQLSIYNELIYHMGNVVHVINEMYTRFVCRWLIWAESWFNVMKLFHSSTACVRVFNDGMLRKRLTTTSISD